MSWNCRALFQWQEWQIAKHHNARAWGVDQVWIIELLFTSTKNLHWYKGIQAKNIFKGFWTGGRSELFEVFSNFKNFCQDFLAMTFFCRCTSKNGWKFHGNGIFEIWYFKWIFFPHLCLVEMNSSNQNLVLLFPQKLVDSFSITKQFFLSSSFLLFWLIYQKLRIFGCLWVYYSSHCSTPDQILVVALGIFDRNFLIVFSNLEYRHCQSHHFYKIMYWPSAEKL